MYLEKLTEEIEDWLEKADEEDNLKFVGQLDTEFLKDSIVVELLGYYGSIGQLIANEIQKISLNKTKLAGFFSSYFSEMVQLISGEILLPITLLQVYIGSQPYIFVISNFAIPDIISYKLAEKLLAFYKKFQVSKILLIDGVYNYKRAINEKPQVHRISSLNYQIKVSNKETADFALMGQIASSFLTYWGDNSSIPIEILVVDSFSDYDPISSLELLKVIVQEWGFKGDFKDLEQKSQNFYDSYSQLKEKQVERNESITSDPRYFI